MEETRCTGYWGKISTVNDMRRYLDKFPGDSEICYTVGNKETCELYSVDGVRVDFEPENKNFPRLIIEIQEKD